MEQTQTASFFGERYEIVGEDEHGNVEVRDHAPWKSCWSCGSTENDVGESFCTNCGADLRNRCYQGIIFPDSPNPVLLSTIKDEAIQSMLPTILDHVIQDNRILVLYKYTDAKPIEPPLEETIALRVGLALARMMMILHEQNLEFGVIVPSDIGLTLTSQPILLNIREVVRISDNERTDVIRSDLQVLAGLLEALTSTPRMTQRLHYDDELTTDTSPLSFTEESGLSIILREIRTGAIHNAGELVRKIDSLLLERTSLQPLKQEVCAMTDVGMLRDHNEDSFLFLKLGMNNTSLEQTWGIYIVADGMGGHAGGEVASGIAIRRAAEVLMDEYLASSLDPHKKYDQERVKAIVYSAVLQANEAVRQEGLARDNDMGTTITMALVVGDRATIANVGDSRTYLYRNGQLRRITKDHSLVMRLVELGQITENDIYTHPQRNAVLRSLGDRPHIDVDIFVERLCVGDKLLLCSDGQWEMTRNNEMERILTMYDNCEQACKELIKAANAAGGEDNITSMLVFLK